MKAVALYKNLPIEDPQSIVDLHILKPNNPASGHDLLVAIKAISDSNWNRIPNSQLAYLLGSYVVVAICDITKISRHIPIYRNEETKSILFSFYEKALATL